MAPEELTLDLVEPTEEYRAAYEYLREGAGNLFVTGRAGTGKSTLLRCLKEMIADEMVVRPRHEKTHEQIAPPIALARRREHPFAKRPRALLRQGVDAPPPLAGAFDRRESETFLLERGEDRIDLRAAELDEVADAKLERGAHAIPAHAEPATASLFIVNPFAGTGRTLLNLFSTHPSTADRVQRLVELARGAGQVARGPGRLAYGAGSDRVSALG